MNCAGCKKEMDESMPHYFCSEMDGLHLHLQKGCDQAYCKKCGKPRKPEHKDFTKWSDNFK